MVLKLGSTRTVLGIGAALALVALWFGGLALAQSSTPPTGQPGPGGRGMGPRMGMGLMGWFDQGPGGMRGRGSMGPMMGLGGPMGLGIPLGRLDLTDAQKEQVKKILESHKAEAQSLRLEAQPLHQALRTAIENNDVNAIQTASTNLASEIAKGATLAAKVRAEVFGVLTDEQKAKAKELSAQAGPRRQKFPGMHQGPPLF